jgi:hypothetical protein
LGRGANSRSKTAENRKTRSPSFWHLTNQPQKPPSIKSSCKTVAGPGFWGPWQFPKRPRLLYRKGTKTGPYGTKINALLKLVHLILGKLFSPQGIETMARINDKSFGLQLLHSLT